MIPTRLSKPRAGYAALRVAGLIFTGCCTSLQAALWLPHSLSDHILFQQKEPIVLWGKAAPMTGVTAVMASEQSGAVVEKGETTAGADGRWQIALPPLTASFTQYAVKVSAAGETREIHDALVGELWLSGGQSNMELQLRYILGGKELMVDARRDGIRIFYQQRVDEAWRQGVPQSPQEDTDNGHWLAATSGANIGDCSGVAYAFALALYNSLNQDGPSTPVGVMNSAVGATGIETWTSLAGMESQPELKAKLPARWNVGQWAQYHQPWHQATALYNLKIAPLTHHAVRGFIWYQGENNAGSGESDAAYYKTAMQALIVDWRNHWGGQPRPFIMTQLAAYDDDGKMPVEKRDSWAYLREAQWEAAQMMPQTRAIPIHDLPLTWNTGDFGYKSPIHPLDKKPVGERMALVARALAYGEPVESWGPVFDRMDIAGRKVVLYFQHAEGLTAGGGTALHGFALCGNDRQFVAADAQIAGDTVEVSNPHIEHPVAVTYGFTSQNHCANLFNGAGLPAAPFRTDKVPSAFLKECSGANP